MKESIFVALSTFGEYDKGPIKIIERSGHPFSINPLGRRLAQEEILKFAKGACGVIAGVESYDGFVLDSLPGLRCISRCGAGTDNIDKEKAKSLGIRVLNTPDVVVQPVAELTVAMIFDLMRKLSYHTGLMRLKKWEKGVGSLLAGKKVGVIGLGSIGKKVCELMFKLDTVVYGTDITVDLQWAKEKSVKIVSLNELLQICDIVSVHVSIDKENPFQLGKRELATMKEGAYLINTSRGQTIDEEALYEALKSGHLSGAGLDVFSQEPYKGKLCDLDNVVLTPHVATLTRESRIKMEMEAASNLINFFKLK
jgi:D-3-phosphoglycerate dehydrogenase